MLVHALDGLTDEGYFAETLKLGRREWVSGYPGHGPAEAFFAMNLGDPWPAAAMSSVFFLSETQDAKIFDLLELLHRDAVSKPRQEIVGEPPFERPRVTFDKTAGRAEFRERMNPILARRDPPLEMDDSGTIVQRVAEPFRRLVEQQLPATTPQREVADRVNDAVAHFRRRTATAGDRRAAVRELADVLEFLRGDVKQHMLKKDEGDLFRIANEFALRHNKPTTRREFDEPVWLAWAFYVYLATIRLTLELRQRASP